MFGSQQYNRPPQNTYRGRQHSAQATLCLQPSSSLLANLVQEIARHVDVQGARPQQHPSLVLAACVGGVHLKNQVQPRPNGSIRKIFQSVEVYHVRDNSIGNKMKQMKQMGRCYVVTYRSNQASWVVVDFQIIVQISVQQIWLLHVHRHLRTHSTTINGTATIVHGTFIVVPGHGSAVGGGACGGGRSVRERVSFGRAVGEDRDVQRGVDGENTRERHDLDFTVPDTHTSARVVSVVKIL